MKYQILLSRKNEENIISLLCAGFVHSMVSVKMVYYYMYIQISSNGYP